MNTAEAPENYSITTRHAGKTWEILVRSDNIVQVNLSAAVYGRSDINEVIEKIRELTNYSTLLVLVIAHKRSRITPDGIRKLFSKMSVSYPVAKAYVINRPLHFMLARLCMRIYKPKTPIKFFASRGEAEKWLLGLISC